MSNPDTRSVDGRFVSVDPFERFMSKVREEDRGYATPCWIWHGSDRGDGYGSFWLDGRTDLAHRVAYTLLIGPIPEGAELDHLCRVRSCVRPLHLEPVTKRVNVLRSNNPMAINARKTTCRRGHPFTGTWRGRRTCRTCSAIRQQEHRDRKATVA